MPRRSPTPRSSPRPRPAAPLALLAQVARHLAGEAPLERSLPAVLEDVRRGTAATGCSLWIGSGHAIRRLSATGDGSAHGAPVTTRAGAPASEDVGVVAAPLETPARRLGALVVSVTPPLPAPRALFLSAVCGLLVATILEAEAQERFAIETARASAQLDAQHRFIEGIVDSLPLSIHVVDREYRIRAWNRNRETGQQGMRRHDVLGRSIFEVLSRQPPDVLRRELDEVFGDGAIRQFETESAVGGERRAYRISRIPMRLDGAAVSHVITIGEDITERRRAEAQAAQAQRLASLGQLSAGVMHEINNPLATIAACAESMALQMVDPTLSESLRTNFTEYLGIVDHEVHRCKHITDGLLDFSRPHGAMRGPVDLNEVVERTLRLLAHHPGFRRVTVHRTLQAGPVLVLASREQLVQVCMALLLNAADAMPNAPLVDVRTMRSSDAEATLEVSDQGQGIAAADLTKIFEPFYTTKAPGRGTGLGLSIAYGIIRDHGGRIDVESEVGSGSVFRVHLPAGGDR